jgi:hypothetical protein
MTHSMLAIGWLALAAHHAHAAHDSSARDSSAVSSAGPVSAVDPATKAATEFDAAYKTNVGGPFRLWLECPIPPDMVSRDERSEKQ